MATELFEAALAKGGGFCSAALANYPLTLFWQGRLAEALKHARQSVLAFRGLSDVFAATFGHAHLGLALAGCGHYAEATQVFEEASQLGRKHEIWTFLARTRAMAAGFHLDVFDFQGNENLAEEAREQARLAKFEPSLISASLDLVLNFARRGEIARAEALAVETERKAAAIGGWHQWLWEARLRQGRAEIACARGDWSGALEWAATAVGQSLARGRAKYVVLGLEARARALARLGRAIEAVGDLRNAMSRARTMGDPALCLRVATALLALDGSDQLLSETRAIANRISMRLPDQEMRQRFHAAPSVYALGPLEPSPHTPGEVEPAA